MKFKDVKPQIDQYFKTVDPDKVAREFGAVSTPEHPQPLNYHSNKWIRERDGGGCNYIIYEWGWEDLGEGIVWEVISGELYHHILQLYNQYLKGGER